MENFLAEKKEKREINKVFIVGVLAGILLLAGAFSLYLYLRPNEADVKAKQLEGMILENSPEFDQLYKDIVISTDFERTTESPTGLGTIQMSIWGKIRNRGAKTINGLQVRVGVVDKQNKVLREKEVLVIPTDQQPSLAPNEIFDAHVVFDGFTKDQERANVRWKVSAIRTQ